MSRSRRSSRHQAPGFSLVEMLVVLVLVALASGLVVTRIGAGRDGAEQRLALRQIVSGLSDARRHALQTGRARSVELSRNGAIKVVSTRDDMPPAPPPSGATRIMFLPDGGSTGGGITLSPPLSARLSVNRFSGGVSVEARDE